MIPLQFVHCCHFEQLFYFLCTAEQTSINSVHKSSAEIVLTVGHDLTIYSKTHLN